MQNSLEASLVRGQSVVTQLVYHSPCRLFSLGPAHPGGSARAVMGSHGGGFIQDDSVQLELKCKSGSTLQLGSQANTQVLTNTCGRAAVFNLNAQVESDATLVYIPEPIVLHAGASYRQHLVFDLAKGSRLAMIDWFQSGRSDSGERFQFTSYHSELDIRYDGQSLMLDSFGFEPKIDDSYSPMTLAGYDHFVNLILVGYPDDWFEQAGLAAESSEERFRIDPFPQQSSATKPAIFRTDWDSGLFRLCRIHAHQRLQINDLIGQFKAMAIKIENIQK